MLFGDYNPAGRLPVTFYRSVDQLPPFDDYKMEGRTYRYFKGEPLYPFGYGLSYSKFEYGNMKVTPKVKAGGDVKVSVDVRNSGGRDGDEVVQLYLTDVAASAPVPIRTLVGISRLNLKAGEKRTVSFTIPARAMSLIDNNGKRIIEPGDYSLSAGGIQPGYTAPTTGSVTGKFTVTGGASGNDGKITVMKVLFIGGTGTISSACSDLAVECGCELFVLNRGTSSRKPPESATVLNADIRDPGSVRNVLGKHDFDAVVDWVAYAAGPY